MLCWVVYCLCLFDEAVDAVCVQHKSPLCVQGHTPATRRSTLFDAITVYCNTVHHRVMQVCKQHTCL